MADNFYPMGGTPDFYAGLLNSAQQQLVRMPDDSLAVAPTYSPPTTLGQIYGGMYSQPGSSGSASLKADPVGDLRASGGFNQLDDMVAASAPLSGHTSQMRVASTGIPSVPGPRGSVALNKDQTRLDPGTALAFAGGPSVPPGVAAINAAAPLNPFIPPLPRIRPQLPSDMQWTPTVPQPFAGGDPWAGKRIGGTVPRGYATGSTTAQVPAVPQQHRGGLLGALFGGLSLPSIPQLSMPQLPPASNAPVAGTSFLNAQGVDTSNMTAGQVANALNDSVRGAGAGQWH